MLFSILASAASVMAIGEHDAVISFEEFLEHYKDHHTATSLLKSMEDRRAAFEANILKIKDHNSKGLSWTMGVNHFADLTADEWQEEVGTSLCVHTMKQSLLAHQERTANHLPQMANPKNAASIDWRTSGAVTDVKNQGQCGSCWAFSTTGSVEGAWKNAHGTLVPLSEQELVDCDSVDSGCNGGLMDYGFEYIMKNGITSEENYKYTARDGTCDTTKQANVVATVKSYKDVTSKSQAALENAVNIGPVSIAIEADKEAFQLYTGGILSANAGCGHSLDHGVLLVGYGAENGEDYWIVKNSWGSGWGEGGYIRMQRGGDGPGTCGLQSQPSYPIAGDAPAPGPTPGPGPTPSPGPSGGDYSDPGSSGSCPETDLVYRDEYGIDGQMCLPKCNSELQCPPGPSGFSNEPTCCVAPPTMKNAILNAVGHPQFDLYCGYQCESDSDCGQGSKCVDYYDVFSLCMFTD